MNETTRVENSSNCVFLLSALFFAFSFQWNHLQPPMRLQYRFFTHRNWNCCKFRFWKHCCLFLIPPLISAPTPSLLPVSIFVLPLSSSSSCPRFLSPPPSITSSLPCSALLVVLLPLSHVACCGVLSWGEVSGWHLSSPYNLICCSHWPDQILSHAHNTETTWSRILGVYNIHPETLQRRKTIWAIVKLHCCLWNLLECDLWTVEFTVT